MIGNRDDWWDYINCLRQAVGVFAAMLLWVWTGDDRWGLTSMVLLAFALATSTVATEVAS